MAIIIGIDPGVSGAVAVHDAGVLTMVTDMPTHAGRTDGNALADLIGAYGPEATVYLEDAHAMPHNGSIASFSLGLNSGIVIGVVQALSHPLVRVRPMTWKSKLHVTRHDKNALRGIVREIYPSWADSFKRVKDHNRAEAVLISRYGVAAELQGAQA